MEKLKQTLRCLQFPHSVAELLLYIWQLPQNLLGLLAVLFTGVTIPIDIRGKRVSWPSTFIYLSEKMKGGISLGQYVVLEPKCFNDEKSWNHERGHHLQSMILGPLYLFIIGLPSLLWAAWWNPKRPRSYYWFYTERWADKLGGVER
jgi:hypothetical protein